MLKMKKNIREDKVSCSFRLSNKKSSQFLLQHFVHNVQFSAESRGLGAILFMGLSKSKFIKAAKFQKEFSILFNVHKKFNETNVINIFELEILPKIIFEI